jgi:hypothetical protein
LVLSAHVNSFQFAGESLMRWLRGGAVAEILEDLGGHLYKTAANPVGFVLQGGEREKGTKGDAKGSGAYNDPRSGG